MMHPDYNFTSRAAIQCGGLYIPHRNVDAVLARSVRPLIFENDTPEYLYSRSGSCTLLHYRGQYFCALTKHQNRDFALAAVRVVKGFSGGASLAFDSFFSVDPVGGEEFEDICVFRVARSVHQTANLNDFFPLAPSEPPIEKSRLLIAIGVPTHMSTIEYEPAQIRATTVTLPCRYVRKLIGPARTCQLEVLSSEGKLPKNLPLDGMSGGGVYSIDGNLGGYKVYFRGIIVRGGRDHIYVVDVSFIREMIAKIS